MTLRDATTRPAAQVQVEDYLQELRERLLEGVVVPFLGAGISYACKLPPTPKSGCMSPPAEACESRGEPSSASGARRPVEFTPQTAELKRSLACWLWLKCKCSRDTAKRAGKLLGLPHLHCSTNEKSFVDCCKPASLSDLAEVCTWLSNSQTVCRVLKISCFQELIPRPAHRYIAYLVREGLIDEVITTNWDTCLEQALRYSFGPQLPNRLAAHGAAGDSPLHVISRIDEYRRWGAYRRRGRGPRQPVLRLYKINGCAAAYSNNPAAEAERIALTERQLQGFRDNHWAADLFRDRARSHRLLFSGFGSAEPQIRHAVTALAAEFAASPAHAHGHAPFVQVYDESPTFSQYQLLRAYYREPVSHLRVGLKQVMTAIHADCFPDPGSPYRTRAASSPPPRDDRLDADRFWFGVYLAAMRGLVERYSEPPFPFYAWLAQHSPAPAREAMRLSRWLYPRRTRRTADEAPGSPPSEYTFGRLIALFLPTAPTDVPGAPAYSDVGCGPLLLSVWLAAIQGRTTSPAPTPWYHDWYVPMRDASLLILSCLYVLMALVPDLSEPDTHRDRLFSGANYPVQPDDPDPRVCTDAQDPGLRVRVHSNTRSLATATPSETPDEPTPTPFDISIVDHRAPNPSAHVPSPDTLRTRIRYELAVSNRLAGIRVSLPRVGRWDRIPQEPEKSEACPPRCLRIGRFYRLPVQHVDFANAARPARESPPAAPAAACPSPQDPCPHRIRAVHAVRLAAARLLPGTRVRLSLRATYGAQEHNAR